MMLISVIIPTYNHGRYILESVNSLINQSFEDWECVVIDDGSTDNTREILRKLIENDERIKYIYQENTGESKARNNAVELCKGKYLFFLDADDVLKINHLESLYQKIFEDNADVVFCDTQIFVDNGMYYEFGDEIVYDAPEGFVKQEQLYKDLFDKNFITMHSALIKRVVFEQCEGFNPENNFFEDYDFWLKAARAGFRFYHLRQKLALYRVLKNKKNANEDYIIKSKNAELEFIRRNFDNRYISFDIMILREKKIYRRLIRDLIRHNFLDNVNEYIYDYFIKFRNHPGDIIRALQFRLLKLRKRHFSNKT